MNWLYDHLRYLPHYTPVVLCDALANREEFPEIDARVIDSENISRRVWRRLAPHRVYPLDRLWLERIRPSLLHSHFGYVAAGDLDLARALRVPWVVSFYGADVYQLERYEEWRATYASVFQRANKVLALGPAMAARLQELGCPPEKVAIHPLGVDIEGLPTARRVLRPDDPLRILFAGTFREKKGIRYVVEAAAQAHQMGVRLELHLVGSAAGKPGDRETEQAVLRLIAQLGIEHLVNRQEFLPFGSLVELALRSHLFIAPSVTAADGDAEGTPFVLQQMMATAMPTIATRHSDIPFLFGDLQEMLVPERDSAAIAERIQGYWKDPDKLSVDGERVRQRMREHYDVRHCAEGLAHLYDMLLIR